VPVRNGAAQSPIVSAATGETPDEVICLSIVSIVLVVC
jgi:hypothetical protein